MGLGLAVTGFALLAARILDVFTDPVIGFAFDRTQHRNRFRLFIGSGSVLAAMGLFGLFAPPAAAGAMHLLGFASLLYFGWTLVQIPYFAWGAALSDGYTARVKVTGVREALALLGIMAAGAWPFLAARSGLSESISLKLLALLAILIGGVFVLLLLTRVPQPQRPPLTSGSLKGLVKNGPFKRLVAAWALNGFANGLPATLFPLFARLYLEVDPVTEGLLLILYFLPGVLGIPIWVLLVKRFDKHRVWCAAMGLACAAFIWTPFLPFGDVTGFALICVFSGFALGADLALPPAIQADVLDWDRYRFGADRAGAMFALWNMVTKLSMAFAVGISFPLLALAGLNMDGPNSAATLKILALTYAGLPVLFKLASILVMKGFPLTRERQGLIRIRLKRSIAGE